MNLETLNQRVQALLGVPKSYNTGYYGVQEAGISHPSIAHNLPCFPGDGSSIPPVADMDVLSNLPVSYGGFNLDANTRSTSNYFSQQHSNNCMLKLVCDFSSISNLSLYNIDFVFAAIYIIDCFSSSAFCSGDGSDKIQRLFSYYNGKIPPI